MLGQQGATRGGQSQETRRVPRRFADPPSNQGRGAKQLFCEILVSGETQAEQWVADLVLGTRPAVPLCVISPVPGEGRPFFGKHVRLSPDL